MKQLLLIVLFACCCIEQLQAQGAGVKKVQQYADLGIAAGSNRASVAASYVYNWQIGKKKKWEAGIGARLTSSFGTKQEYTTAPARLSRSSTIPFLVALAGQQTENWDTLTVQRPWVNALNITANFAYNFNPKWQVGFNIDLIGLAVGRTSPAILTSNGITRTEQAAKVVPFNVLLTGDLDYGNLNSEFFVKYKWNDRWGIRGVYQYVFNEYKTTSIFQTAPDGTTVTRFRQKANNLGVAITYHF